MSKDSINKTTLYEERKRNEVPKGKLTGFSPLAKPTGGKPKFDVRTVVLDSLTMSSFCSLSSYSTFYPGFWYATRVAARARKVRTGIRKWQASPRNYLKPGPSSLFSGTGPNN